MELELRRQAENYLARLGEPQRSAVAAAIDKLGRDPPQGDIEPIIGQKGYFRARAGGLRILYTVREDRILITNIVPRGQAYNKKEKKK